MQGFVTCFDPVKGFGFISPDDGPDIFFHRSGVAQDDAWALAEGAPVDFDVAPGKKGPRAVNVRPIWGKAERRT